MAEPREFCPTGCGWPTDDPHGGACSDCWEELRLDRLRLWSRDAEPCDGYLEHRGSWRPVVVMDPGTFL